MTDAVAPSTPSTPAAPVGKASKYDLPAGVVDTSATPKAASTQTPESKPLEAKAIEKAIQKFKVKIDGTETEVALDDLLTNYQKGVGAEKKFQEAAEARKQGETARRQAEEFIKILKQDPLKVLNNPNLGIDFKKLAQEYLISEAKKGLMTPAEKEAYEAKQQLEEYRRRDEEAKKSQETQRIEQLTNAALADYNKTIPEAITKVGLPKTNYTVARMAYYLHQGLQNGRNLTPDQVANQVKQDYLTDVKELFGATDGDTLLSVLGEDTAKKLRAVDVARLKQVGKTPEKPIESKPSSKNGQSNSKKLKAKDWRRKILES